MVHFLHETLGFFASLAFFHLTFASPIHPQPSPAAISLPLIARQKRVYVPHDYDTSNSTKRFRVADDSQTWKGGLYYDTTEYLIEVGIGTSDPPQKYYFMLDTGSNVMWVYSNGCPEAQCGPSRFNYEVTSKSYRPTMEQVYYSYLDETFIVGYMGSDVITVGPIQVNDQQFVAVDEAIGVLHYDKKQDINSIGMFGLAYPSDVNIRVVGDKDTKIQKRAYMTPLKNMREKGLIPHGMFSMYLGPETKQGDSNGHILIGNYDIELIKEEPLFVSTILAKSGLPEDYALYIEGLSLFKDAPGHFQDDHLQTVIQAAMQPSLNTINVIKEWNFADDSSNPINIAFDFDTGTPDSFFYAGYTTEMFKLITGTTKDPQEEDWDIDCSYLQSDIYLRIRVSHEYKQAKADSDPNPLYLDVPISAFIKKKDTCGCEWTLGAHEPETGNMMLGQDFLRYFYLVHDFDHNQLGFAVPKDRSSRVGLKSKV
ncbi:hypothetical protein MAM1_0083c04620 [Mucor ambiguus]|uniref:rhizopuspepsin n=1 Tax=Mucor ambiguus TaxID=91626 RepID=A0A0C9M614_9FUNG|nr:hypothetical protein MAM1_0083c04620 [Mucor ambiguus]